VGEGSELAGRTFISTAIMQDGKPHALSDGAVIRLTLTGPDKITARGGCNTLDGSVEYVARRLVVSRLVTTDMACAAAQVRDDDWLRTFLESDPDWVLTGDELRLSTDNTVVTMTDREVAEPDRALVGTRWVVQAVEKNGSVSSVPGDREAFLTFSADGKVQGRSACNQFGGDAKVDGDKIAFSDLFSTKMACPDDVMTVENTMLAVMSGVAVFDIDGDQLTLTGPDGQRIRLRAQ
jgi:heat shock protein HslJ